MNTNSISRLEEVSSTGAIPVLAVKVPYTANRVSDAEKSKSKR
jgi:hypothetical protein